MCDERVRRRELKGCMWRRLEVGCEPTRCDLIFPRKPSTPLAPSFLVMDSGTGGILSHAGKEAHGAPCMQQTLQTLEARCWDGSAGKVGLGHSPDPIPQADRVRNVRSASWLSLSSVARAPTRRSQPLGDAVRGVRLGVGRCVDRAGRDRRSLPGWRLVVLQAERGLGHVCRRVKL